MSQRSPFRPPHPPPPAPPPGYFLHPPPPVPPLFAVASQFVSDQQADNNEIVNTWANYRVRHTRTGALEALRSCYQNEVNYCSSLELLESPEFSLDGRRSLLGFQHWSGCLKCPICLDYLTDSTVLPCGHTFCRRCLWRIIRQRQEDYMHIHPRSLFFFCPTCRHKISVRTFVRFAPGNLAVNSTVESWLTSTERLECFKEAVPARSAPSLSVQGQRYDDVVSFSNLFDTTPHAASETSVVTPFTTAASPTSPLTASDGFSVWNYNVQDNVASPSTPSVDAVPISNISLDRPERIASLDDGIALSAASTDVAGNISTQEEPAVRRRNFSQGFRELCACVSGRLRPEQLSADALSLLDGIVTSSSPNLREVTITQKLQQFEAFVREYYPLRGHTAHSIFTPPIMNALLIFAFFAAGFWGINESMPYFTAFALVVFSWIAIFQP